MLSANDYGTNLMKAIANGTTVSFPTPYLGLFVELPGTDMSGGDEVSYPEYCRVQLNVTGVNGIKILTDPYLEDGTNSDGDAVKVTKIKNQDYIYWPENETGDVQIAVGWGLFSSKTATKPYMAGKLKTNVTIKTNSIPEVRVGNLMLGVK